ncbi:hypothetical protein P171DRAFT_437314 [Karstenula rhodostoma CBS 690.94]|uniref:DNA-binding protein RAP1 n=1 Tax=Karstenula rhodostoma CBS 690.94 TaxID=1392251 RepID=A0A9P4P6G3_9PLEO|nr:hypothetical protein P171DRAFT_437314 [Karstenula rhodostoma CBS 690.94]
MAAPVVYRDVAPGADLHGQLFAGKKFWVAQRVVSRPRYLDLIRSNGGEVVLLEKKADYLIADHARHDCPPGSISYTFIDESIEKGELQDPEGHGAGLSEEPARAPGSLSRPAKTTRNRYTLEEDRILYKWVNDSKNAGKLTSGNEIYKQLEKQHPRHTWQSWRDRYLKTLCNRPPPGLNVPDNAPPFAPSDAPVEPASASASAAAPAPARTQSSRPATGESATDSRKAKGSTHVDSVEYTVDELTAPGLFAKEDWEMLYAFALDITGWPREEYRDGWRKWAEDRPQTTGQWRQYFEKVVWPQWQQDSDEKHAIIKSRVERRLDEDEQNASQTTQHEALPKHEPLQAGPSTPSSRASNMKRKRTELDDESKDDRAANDTITLSSQVFLSSSTVVNETPKYISEAYQKALQQLRVGSGTREPSLDAQDVEVYPAKRQKNIPRHLGTEEDPVEVSSAGTDSQQLTQDELPEVRSTAQPMDDGDDWDMEGLEAIAPPQRAIDQDGSEHLSDSPTPRAARSKASAFDTQAILSSPSQGASLNPLPLPARLTQLAEADTEDSGEKLASDASTTESLQEFSQMINEDSHYRGITPLPRLQHSSPPQSPASIVSSTGSGDPDPPLAPDEVDEYFKEQHAEGFPDEFIAAALKHTRWRPELATEVLQAWKKRQPLPSKRGIWSDSDDEEVEGGDGMALARLENKHTLDGWGGITERMNFLSKYRSAKE